MEALMIETDEEAQLDDTVFYPISPVFLEMYYTLCSESFGAN